MKYDPAKVSERSFEAPTLAWLLDRPGWSVFAQAPGGLLYNYWPDGQVPEGIFFDESEAREWARGMADSARARGVPCRVVVIKTAPVEEWTVRPTEAGPRPNGNATE